jgi:hypothetical protein
MTERTHGGRRAGAGRPRTTTEALVPRTIRLTREEWAALDAEAKRQGLSNGRLVALLIRRLAGREGVR